MIDAIKQELSRFANESTQAINDLPSSEEVLRVLHANLLKYSTRISDGIAKIEDPEEKIRILATAISNMVQTVSDEQQRLMVQKINLLSRRETALGISNFVEQLEEQAKNLRIEVEQIKQRILAGEEVKRSVSERPSTLKAIRIAEDELRQEGLLPLEVDRELEETATEISQGDT